MLPGQFCRIEGVGFPRSFAKPCRSLPENAMNEESIFHEALARPTGGERARFLDEACVGRPELRAAVESLLQAHEEPGDFLVRSGPVLLAASSDDDAVVPSAETMDLSGTTDPEHRPQQPQSPEVPEPELPKQIGRYQICQLLGRGGMGVVYLAHDPELDRSVALKVPRLLSVGAEDRFLREARVAAAVTHPNLCPVHDAGRADGILYLAMAYIPGSTLSSVLRTDGPLPAARSANLVAAIARGMAEAHRHGIVHRDLKPGTSCSIVRASR
jgi:hypothetical protein